MKVENSQFHDILFYVSSIPSPQTNVLIGNTEEALQKQSFLHPILIPKIALRL